MPDTATSVVHCCRPTTTARTERLKLTWLLGIDVNAGEIFRGFFDRVVDLICWLTDFTKFLTSGIAEQLGANWDIEHDPANLAGRIIDCESNIVITADQGRRGGKRVPLKNNVDERGDRVTSLRTDIASKH